MRTFLLLSLLLALPSVAGADPSYMEWPTLQGAGKKKPVFSFTAPSAGAYASLTAATGQSLSITRASTGTYQTSATALATASSGQFRLDYRGLLVEESRTNIVLQSGNLAASPWTARATGAAPAIATGGHLAPDGSSTAAQVTWGAVASSQYSLWREPAVNLGSLTAGQWRTSIYTSVASGTAITFLNMDQYGDVSCPATATWSRCIMSLTSTNTIYDFDWGFNDANFADQATAGAVAFGWGAQVEQGAFATSYIPTTTTAVTRAADVIDVGAVTLSATPSLSATVNLEGLPASGTATVLDATDGTNSLILAIDTSGHAKCTYGASSDTTAGTVTPGTASKVVCKYDGSTISACIGSTCHGTTASLTPSSSYTHLYVGSTGSAAYLNGFASTLCADKKSGGC